MDEETFIAINLTRAETRVLQIIRELTSDGQVEKSKVVGRASRSLPRSTVYAALRVLKLSFLVEEVSGYLRLTERGIRVLEIIEGRRPGMLTHRRQRFTWDV